LYDYILLIYPSVVYLEQLLRACECELDWLDMSISLYTSRHVVFVFVPK